MSMATAKINFPCPLCSYEAQDASCVECDGCGSWSHLQCLNVSRALIDEWTIEPQFFCRECAFRDGRYDCHAALKRIELHLKSKGVSLESTRAICNQEDLLIRTHHADLLSPFAMPSTLVGEEDEVSCQILSHLHPVVKKTHSPRKIRPDGSCFYR